MLEELIRASGGEGSLDFLLENAEGLGAFD
jgi:hypothetical protein